MGKFKLGPCMVALIALTILSCQVTGSHSIQNGGAVIPGLTGQDRSTTDLVSRNDKQDFHYLWGYYLFQVDPENDRVDILPVRDVSNHWNVLKWLEQGPCTKCVAITGITPNPSGSKSFGVKIKHPFPTPSLTGFDVRGIAIFDGNHTFPVAGLTSPDMGTGDGELVNADGYTTLFNGTTSGSGPGGLQGYMKGKFATVTVPDAELNGFKRHITDDPANTRNAFYAGDEITATYEIMMPTSSFVFGYAIDASWAPATNKPVTDPMTDFGPEANCPEPWKVEVTDLGPGLSQQGGITALQIDVFDWQGKDSHHSPVVECLELFDGTVTAVFDSDGSGFSTWQATITNPKQAIAGDYRCLVSVEDNLNDPVGQSWLDLTAYQITPIHVSEIQNELPIAIATAEPNLQTVGQSVNFDDDDSYDPDGGTINKYEWDWDNDGTFDEEGAHVSHSWLTPGLYQIQFKVTDDEGTADTLDSPIGVAIIPESIDLLKWVRSAGSSTGADEAANVTVLPDDSTVVTGSFTDSATFGAGEPNETTLTSAGAEDMFIARYNPSGSLIWAKRAGGYSYFDNGRALAALSDDSIIVTGDFREQADFGKGEANETTLYSSGASDIFIAKYYSDGLLAWAKKVGGINNGDSGSGVTTLSDDTFTVVGTFSDSVIFGQGEANETELKSAGLEGWSDLFIARYNPEGSLVWAKRAGGENQDYCNSVTALSDDSAVFSGNFFKSCTFGEGEPNETVLTAIAYNDAFIARYNPDGTLAWAKQFGGAMGEYSYGITTLSDDSAVVTGFFQGSSTFGAGESNETVLTSFGGDDVYIARYNPDGTLSWAKRAGGPSTDHGFGATTLSDDSIVLTGFFAWLATFGEGDINQTILTGEGGEDIFIAQYNSDGTLAWAKHAGGSMNDEGHGIIALSDDSVVVTGWYWESAIFGEGEVNETTLTSAGGIDVFVARYGL